MRRHARGCVRWWHTTSCTNSTTPYTNSSRGRRGCGTHPHASITQTSTKYMVYAGWGMHTTSRGTTEHVATYAEPSTKHSVRSTSPSDSRRCHTTPTGCERGLLLCYPHCNLLGGPHGVESSHIPIIIMMGLCSCTSSVVVRSPARRGSRGRGAGGTITSMTRSTCRVPWERKSVSGCTHIANRTTTILYFSLGKNNNEARSVARR